MNSIRALLLFLWILLAGLVSATAEVPEGVELSLRLYDKKIYHPDSAVTLHVGIVNSSSSPFAFHIADTKLFSLDLTVRNLHNEKIDPTREYIRRKSSNQQVLYREIRLLPGEEYAFLVQLSSFVRIEQPGIYFLRASLQTDMESSQAIDSNEISLHIRPGGQNRSSADDTREQIAELESEALKQRSLAPDEVVRYMIDARKRGEWKKFFLYLDVQSLMLEHQLKKEQWVRRSDVERQRMLEDYKEMLKSSMVNSEILLVPTSYKLIGYQVNLQDREEATVEVRARFKYRNFTEIKKFTYFLHRKDGYWEIYRYEVNNEGTE